MSEKRVEVKTRTSRRLRSRFAKVAERHGRSVSAELELAMTEHVKAAELELELEAARRSALERLAGV